MVDFQSGELSGNSPENSVAPEPALSDSSTPETAIPDTAATLIPTKTTFDPAATALNPATATPNPTATIPDAATAIPDAALGPFGDIPAACAVFRITLDETRERALDATYLYVNQKYCDQCRCEEGGLIGHSYLEFSDDDESEWLEQCKRAVVDGVTINDVVYSPLALTWISYNIAPSPVEGCCVYAFVNVDDERRGRLKMAVGSRTSRLITETLNALNGEKSHEAAMRGMLEMIATVIHPDRLRIFERGEFSSTVTFEWHDENAASQVDAVRKVPSQNLEVWYEMLAKDPILVIPNVNALEKTDEVLYDRIAGHGVKRLMAVPFYNDGLIVGFLEADNYKLDRKVDLNRLLEAVSSFIGARIANQRLIHNLAWSGEHDALTRLLNRRGIDQAVAELRRTRPDEPYVLALLDLDDFKKANDIYGHAAGDAALKAMARSMVAHFPEDAILGRNGGDEFLVVLHGDDVHNADAMIEAFSTAGVEYEHEGKRHHLTTSIGYAQLPTDADNWESLYSKADMALYAVKLDGKNGFNRYTMSDSKYRTRLGFTPRDLADNIPGAMIVHRADDEGLILFVNDELVRMFGCEDVFEFLDLTEGTFWGMIHPDDREKVRQALASQVTMDDVGGKTFANFRVVTKSGASKNVFESGRLISIDNIGKVFYVLLVDWAEYDLKMDRVKAAQDSAAASGNA